MPIRQRSKDRLLSASHVHAPRQERKLAKSVGGRVTKGSGNSFEKGDVRVEGEFRIECKCTQKKSYSLKRETFDKVQRDALLAGEKPVFNIQFLEEEQVLEDLAVIPMKDYLEMVELLRECER